MWSFKTYRNQSIISILSWTKLENKKCLKFFSVTLHQKNIASSIKRWYGRRIDISARWSKNQHSQICYKDHFWLNLSDLNPLDYSIEYENMKWNQITNKQTLIRQEVKKIRMEVGMHQYGWTGYQSDWVPSPDWYPVRLSTGPTG